MHDRLLQVVELESGHAKAARNSLDYAKREVIRGISQKSRTRLIRFLSTINRPDPAFFVTLTYREWSEDFVTWKAHLHTVLMALRRRYPGSTGVWRLEFQERGAPHFHLILWLGQDENREALWSWLRNRWVSTIGDQSEATKQHSVTVADVTDFRNCGFYLSLYQAKDQQDRKDIQTGREWGKIQPRLLCTDPIRAAVLTRTDVRLLRRTIRRAHRATIRSGFRKSRYWKSLGKEGRGFSMCLPFHSQKKLVDWVLKVTAEIEAQKRWPVSEAFAAFLAA